MNALLCLGNSFTIMYDLLTLLKLDGKISHCRNDLVYIRIRQIYSNVSFLWVPNTSLADQIFNSTPNEEETSQLVANR